MRHRKAISEKRSFDLLAVKEAFAPSPSPSSENLAREGATVKSALDGADAGSDDFGQRGERIVVVCAAWQPIKDRCKGDHGG